VLQGGVDWETGCSGYDAVIFQYSFGVNNNSISPQMSCKYRGSRGNFMEICNRMVYYPVLSLTQDISAVVYKCPEFGCVTGWNSWSKVKRFWEKQLVDLPS